MWRAGGLDERASMCYSHSILRYFTSSQPARQLSTKCCQQGCKGDKMFMQNATIKPQLLQNANI